MPTDILENRFDRIMNIRDDEQNNDAYFVAKNDVNAVDIGGEAAKRAFNFYPNQVYR